MTLQQIAQLLGAIGVIASLIYVAIQIRNNSRAVRAAAYQQLSSSFIASYDAYFQNAEGTALMLKGGDDFSSLDRLEQTRYFFLVMALMRRFENAWFQFRIGTLKDDDWQAIAYDLNTVFAYPGAREAWHIVKNRNNAEFRAYVDGIVERQAAAATRPKP